MSGRHDMAVDVEHILASAPTELRHSTQRREIVLTLARDVIAEHDAGVDRPRAHGHGVPGVAITPVDEAPTTGVVFGPVYRRTPDGGLAIPTGSALVRFGDGDRAEQHRDELAAAGFGIERVLAYAPQAAWVRARSGEITDTLRGLARLERLPGVQNVEPQLVSQPARRH